MIDISLEIDAAFAIDDCKSHRKHAESRDAMLALIAAHPDVFDDPSPQHLRLIRGAAERCGNVGPFAKAIALYRRLARLSNEASDWCRLSEVLAHADDECLDEAFTALEMAMKLDPVRFDTRANRETLNMVKC